MIAKRVAALKTAEQFKEYLDSLGVDLPFDNELESGESSCMEASLAINGHTVGNRWAINPMEGWDATRSGGSSPEMKRRWERFCHGVDKNGLSV